jgi:hypothetical protein
MYGKGEDRVEREQCLAQSMEEITSSILGSEENKTQTGTSHKEAKDPSFVL